MVSRVDKKPIIYNTCLVRAWKPAIVAGNKKLINTWAKISHGHHIPAVGARDLLDDFEDISLGFKMFGINDPACSFFSGLEDVDDDESIRIARSCLSQEENLRKALRSEAMMDEISKVQLGILSGVDRVYFGTEAVYQLLGECLNGNVFESNRPPSYRKWVMDTTQKVMVAQSPYLFIHPTAIHAMSSAIAKDVDVDSWYHWDMFKKMETLALRIHSRRNLLAHAHYYGINKKGFSASDEAKDDFEIRLHEEHATTDKLKVYYLMGLKYFVLGTVCYVVSSDDCINWATMAQCYYRVGVYFTPSNGYTHDTSRRALSLVRDITRHCCNLIDAKLNFSHAIRSLHILAQGDFNDAYEDEMGTDLGWADRSANYQREAKELDPMAATFHRRALDLAIDNMDKLNVGFIYHVFVGDEMLIEDLRSKVEGLPSKVKSADAGEWSMFIKFCKAYFLSRFMMVNKRKPACGGDVFLLNSAWADRCVAGNFTMAPTSDWGKVWIQGEFSYSEFANIWHLEAQDVAYVVKDSEGLRNGKYKHDRLVNSELLMAMTSGNILDTISGSTPRSARDRIRAGECPTEVVLTTAPKAENAKPSWKKRVTFAADCEFRKMQAEYDRNCRKVMGFVRGPSLGVDQCVLEKQFADIAAATALGTQGGICSHDISAWSESMDRGRKFEFESILINMLDEPKMSNISLDWGQIKAVVLKQGCKDVVALKNGSYQGFDGSASTILHSMILLYCIDSARRKSVMSTSVKTNMATLIDDCIALMHGLSSQRDANAFWAHLKTTYLNLGFEVDDLKSIFSTIKAIYLSRRFLNGGEVPADFKVFLKAHISYEDPLRCSMDAASDIMGAMRGAADANGEVWYIYFVSVMSILAEIAHMNGIVTRLPPSAACIYALAPSVENGWGIPSILDWATNDIVDKRCHFNAILEALANHMQSSKEFLGGVDVYPRPTAQAVLAIKSQAWRLVSHSNLFTNPFEALREGPMKPDMLRRNAVQDLLREVATAEPWCSLLCWNTSRTTERVRELLIRSGPLHAPTLAALVNCMPDNYRLSLVGKAVGSQSLLDLLPKGARSVLKRRVMKCSSAFYAHSVAMFESTSGEYRSSDFNALTYIERSRLEREEFYTANGVNMIDHTFPDPVYSLTVTGVTTGSVISPNLSSLNIWDKMKTTAHRTSHLIAGKGIYVPRRSNRVWEITSEYAKGWDSVSQRVAMGLAIIARAEADGHRIDGLLAYFIKAWNELSNITPRDTHLISIHGSIKRLDANPGSSTHPVIINRNILRGFNNKIKTALDAIPKHLMESAGSAANLHDPLAHEVCLLAVTALQFSTFMYLGHADYSTAYNIAARPDCIVGESPFRMSTHLVADRINIEIMDGEDNYGLLQACPALAVEIAIPTMKSAWVKMINALIDGDHTAAEKLRKDALTTSLDELLQTLHDDEVSYSTAVIIAGEPANRSSVAPIASTHLAVLPVEAAARVRGDGYTLSVNPIASKYSRALTQDQPDYIRAAVAIRSVVWSRLKTRSATALAKIFYQDPDAPLDVLSECKSDNFWRGVVIEVSKIRCAKRLSEMLMMGFKSLGVPDIHIKASDDIHDVTHSVSSFFGAHIRHATILVSDQVLAIAGRSAAHFSRPLLERIVTNNPSLYNSRLRREHLTALLEYNKECLSDRIDRILSDEITHRGDKRACALAAHPRLVELRCRKYVYMHFSADESGRAEFHGRDFGEFIGKCAKTVAERVKVPEQSLPKIAETFEDTLQYMWDVNGLFKGLNSGWDAQSGTLGARLAYDTVISDSDNIAATQFAVSAAEIAPRLHKRLTYTAAAEPEIQNRPPDPFPDFNFDSDDDDEDLLAMDDDELSAALTGGMKRLMIPAWQALYTLLYNRTYSNVDLKGALNVDICVDPGPSDLREAHLEDFNDDDIYAAFPSLMGDYIATGSLFDPEWLDRDEADAYTTDELGRGQGGALF